MNYNKIIWMLLLLAATLSGQWEPVGPYVCGSLGFLTLSLTNDANIYVTASKAPLPAFVAKSTSGGLNWKTIGVIPTSVNWMTIAPTNERKLYATCDSLIYRSTDGGTSWIQTIMSNKIFNVINVNPSDTTVIYAGGSSCIDQKWLMAFFKSTDSGISWTTVTPDTTRGSVSALAMDNADPQIIYIGGYCWIGNQRTPKIFKSVNGGLTWSDATGNIPTYGRCITSLAIHPTNSNILYAGTYMDGIYRSTNAGASWTRVFSTSFSIAKITTSINSPDLAYAGGWFGIYKTTDAGASWYPVYDSVIGDLVASAQNALIVYAITGYNIFKTSDGGISWVNINNDLNFSSITTFTNAPSSPSTIYASVACMGDDVGIFKTTNSGTDWFLLPTSSACGSVCEIAVAYNDPNVVYLQEGKG